MHAVYGPTGDMIYGPVLTAGDAQAYMDESAVVCDTSGWAVLPVQIMENEKPTDVRS